MTIKMKWEMGIKTKCLKIEKIPFEKSDRNSQREIYRREPSIEKLTKHTNYTPKIKLDVGIKDVLSEA